MKKRIIEAALLVLFVFMSSLTVIANVRGASNVDALSRKPNDLTSVSGSSLDDIDPLTVQRRMVEGETAEQSQLVEGLHLDILESGEIANASTSPVFAEDFEGAWPGDNWLAGDANSDNGLDYWDDTSYRQHGGSWSGWCAQIGTQTSTSILFYEDFEGSFPGSWNVGDSNPDSGEDYWDDTSYRSYEGSWSGWCADIGTKITTTTIFYEDFEGAWPGSWVVGDSNSNEGYDYWGDYYDTTHPAHEGSWDGYCADEGSHPSGCGYDDEMDAYMYRSVSLSGYSSVTLSYYYWLDSEPNYDILYVIHYDGSWHFIDEHTGNSGGWQYSSVSIPTSASYVGLHFYSDGSICDYDGAFVDEVRLRGISEIPNNSVHEYDNDMQAYMYRSVSLSGYSSATFSYRYWLDCESGYDTLYVVYYDGSWHFIDEHTGNSGGWQYSSLDIPTSATQVGLHFISDSSVSSYEGAYVDNVRLTATGNIPNSDLHTYDDYMDAYMVRKYVIDASGWSSATLSYYAWYETESGLDYLQVIVTGDGGENWYYLGDQLSGSSDWAYHSLPIPSTYFTSQFGIGFMFHSDSSIHYYEGAYIDDINLEAVELNHPPVVSDGYVTPTSGYPDTVFTFRVKYTDSDGDPADTRRLILDDDGIFYFDMYHLSGNPIDGEWFEVQVTDLHPDSQVGEHRFFFYFTDGRGGEDYDPDEGWHPGPVVNEFPGEPDIRLQYDSLSFEYPESSSLPGVEVSEMEGNDTFGYRARCTVDFGALFLESEGNHTAVSSPGCDRIFETGKPILPAKTFYILLPPGTHVTSSKVILCDKVDLRDEYSVQIAPTPEILGDFPPEVGTDNPAVPHPKQIVRINGVHRFRGYRLLSLTFFAAQYYPSSHRLFKINKLGMELELCKIDEQAVESLFRGSAEDESIVKTMVMTPEVTSLYSEMPSMERTVMYKYVIITSSGLVDAFQPLVDWKVQKVGSATTVTVSSITSGYPGRDTQEKIRNFVIDKYTNWGTEWILLGGDVEVVPYRGVYGNAGGEEDFGIPCDLYYSDLDGDWDADGDSIFGEVADNVDLYPDVYVGRASVNTASEATVFVNKVLTYERNPPLGYLLNALMIAYWLDETTNGAVLKDYISNNYLADYTITKIYEPSHGAGVDKTAVINSLNSGQGIVNHDSHANYWTTPPLDRPDVDSLNNGEKYFIFYSMGCLTNKFEEIDSISEHYILNSHGGAVAYIGNSRYGWYWPGHPGDGTSDKYDKEFFNCLHDGYNHIGETLARSKMAFIPQSGSDGSMRWVQYCLNLLGDPEMTIRTEANPSQSDTVYNDGTDTLQVYNIRDCYTSGEPTGWLSASPTTFDIEPGGFQVVIVTVDPASLPPDTYHGWLEIDNNDPDEDENPYTVTVTLNVLDVTSPETTITGGPSGTINYNDVTFSWTGLDDVTPTPDLRYQYYLVGYDLDWSSPTYDTSKQYYDLPDNSYTFKVRAIDQAGNIDPTPAQRSFTVDATPPTIIDHTPTGADVPVTTTITVTFSEAMNQPSAENAFSISPSVSGSFSWSSNTMIFTPDSNLSYYATYSVTIGTEAMDLADNHLESPFTWDFTTEREQCLVTFYTEPSTVGNITFEGQTYTDGQSDMFAYDTSGLSTANAPEGWAFDHWEATGNIEVSNSTKNPTTVTITCGGNLTAVFTPTEKMYQVVRGMNDGIYYNVWDCTGELWEGWTSLPGSTSDSPAAAVCCNELHMMVRGTDGKLYHGRLDLSTGSFLGWSMMSGATPSAPELTCSDNRLYLVVRGTSDGIWYNVWDCSISSWVGWTGLPGLTVDSPAAAVCCDELHIVVRGKDNHLYHGRLDLSTGSFLGWSWVSGATPSAPELACTDSKLYLVVQGTDNKIYYNVWDCSTQLWGGWTGLPGATTDSPAAAVCCGELHMVVRGTDGKLYHGRLDLSTGSFLGWSWVSGATPSAPELAC